MKLNVFLKHFHHSCKCQKIFTISAKLDTTCKITNKLNANIEKM